MARLCLERAHTCTTTRLIGYVDDDGHVEHDAVTFELDHVLIAVPDLDGGARFVCERYGLASVEGGRHPDWGTANRIVPVGDAYLELIAIVDRDRALGNTFGRWVAGVPDGLLQPLGWAVRTTSIDTVAQRLGLVVHSGSRTRPDGRVLEWRLAGVERAASDHALPFFIQWAPGTPHPSNVVSTPVPATVSVCDIELRGDADELKAWLGDQSLPVVIRPGPSAVTCVVVRDASGHEFRVEPAVV